MSSDMELLDLEERSLTLKSILTRMRIRVEKEHLDYPVESLIHDGNGDILARATLLDAREGIFTGEILDSDKWDYSHFPKARQGAIGKDADLAQFKLKDTVLSIHYSLEDANGICSSAQIKCLNENCCLSVSQAEQRSKKFLHEMFESARKENLEEPYILTATTTQGQLAFRMVCDPEKNEEPFLDESLWYSNSLIFKIVGKNGKEVSYEGQIVSEDELLPDKAIN